MSSAVPLHNIPATLLGLSGGPGLCEQQTEEAAVGGGETRDGQGSVSNHSPKR